MNFGVCICSLITPIFKLASCGRRWKVYAGAEMLILEIIHEYAQSSMMQPQRAAGKSMIKTLVLPIIDQMISFVQK